MGKEECPVQGEPLPPLLGHAFHLHLKPADRLTWVGAGWAAVCGMVAAGTLHLGADIVARALLTLVLCDLVLGTVWATLVGIWHPARDQLPGHESNPGEPGAGGEPNPRGTATSGRNPGEARRAPAGVEDLDLEATETALWTSMAPGFDGPTARRSVGSLHPSVGSVRASRLRLTASYRRQIGEVGILCGLALLLGLVLGRGVGSIVALGLLYPLVIWFSLGGYPLRDAWSRALLQIGLPWTIGLAALTALPTVDVGGLSGLTLSILLWAGEHISALAVGLLFVVVYYGELTLGQPVFGIGRRTLVVLPQVVAVSLLIAWHQPLLASAAAMLVLAQMLFQPYLSRHQLRWYLRTTQWMFMGVMLMAALGLAAGAS